MPYEYLASVQSAVRRINDRLKTIESRLGSASTLLQKYQSLIDVNLGENTRFKNGVMQIHSPSDIYNNPEKMEALKKIEDEVKTWGEIKKNYEKGYEQYKERSESDFLEIPSDIETYINVNNELPQALIWMYPPTNEDQEKAIEIMKRKGQKTYDELAEAIGLARSGQRQALTERAREKRYGVRKLNRPKVNI